jgi:hypothetical protein
VKVGKAPSAAAHPAHGPAPPQARHTRLLCLLRGAGQGLAVSHANQQHELRQLVCLCAYDVCVFKSAKMQCNLSPCARAETTHPGDGSAWTANAPRMHFAEADHRTCH